MNEKLFKLGTRLEKELLALMNYGIMQHLVVFPVIHLHHPILNSFHLIFIPCFHQEICKTIDSLEPLIKDALKAGDNLLPHCDDDDKDLVKMKMDKLKSKYKDLLRNSDEKRAKIKEAKQLSEKFFSEKDDLTNWFDDMEKKLSDAKAEGQEAEDEQAKLKVQNFFTFWTRK